MKANLKTTLCALPLALLSNMAMAGWSTTITGTSDYTFNGVSQTQSDPTIQGSLDYAADAGWYVGTWASGVDFGEDTGHEWDFYVGRSSELSSDWTVDYGIAYYTYHGHGDSSDFNYPEVYTKFAYASSLGTTDLNFWYSWDYFGVGVGHSIVMLSHTFDIADNHSITLSGDVSNSFDADKYAWDGLDSSYTHYAVSYTTTQFDFDLTFTVEDTTIDGEHTDERFVFSIARTFDL
ncbi:TorF family putative porin [Pseudoalteromonas sp. OOF1S-7]|uniref:TorF family putative porin n=1 Tax=Pseudoalteromonas sp. OOF1S-7 TaxID=2917757 RepID=UPI001EF5E486|nr:TorF family putative porin [Pseudoalteromonas sp. OOF1S-7]MCG7535599.1 TorF family putative porin [Pseudoalteromonas sp. OOF1S-7]